MPFQYCYMLSIFGLMPIKYSIKQLYPNLISKSPILTLWIVFNFHFLFEKCLNT